jgi:hypothetical protein
MSLTVEIRSRGNDTILPLNLKYEVDSYSHAAIGGPRQATITATGTEHDLWELIERVRCPVVIYDKADPVWWGYVAGVSTAHYSISIDEMYNKIAVAYMQLDGETEERQTTEWANDAISQAAYGIKELLWSASSASSLHAETARDTKLAQLKFPVPSRPITDEKVTEAQIVCRGWWDTLGWRYYINPGEMTVDTAEQVEAIISETGQFFRSLDLAVSSGIEVTETRDGDATALYEVNQLLELGTTNYRRMLAKVDQWRTVRIIEEPALTSLTYRIRTDGTLLSPYGQVERKTLCPAGVWMRLEDAVPATVDMSLIGDPSLIFVETMEYDAREDRLTPTPRGHLDPWAFPVVKDG